MAEIFIYSSLNLREARGNLEDDLADFLDDAGRISGGGGGARGWNIDLEVTDKALPEWIEKVKDFLVGWGVPPDTFLDVWEVKDGVEQNTRYEVFDTPEVMEWINTTLTFLAERMVTNPLGWQAIKQEIQAKLVELER